MRISLALVVERIYKQSMFDNLRRTNEANIIESEIVQPLKRAEWMQEFGFWDGVVFGTYYFRSRLDDNPTATYKLVSFILVSFILEKSNMRVDCLGDDAGAGLCITHSSSYLHTISVNPH